MLAFVVCGLLGAQLCTLQSTLSQHGATCSLQVAALT